MKEEIKKKLYKELVQDTIDNRNDGINFYFLFGFLLFISGMFIAFFSVSNIVKYTDEKFIFKTSPENIQGFITQILFGGICIAASLIAGLLMIDKRISGNRQVDYEKELYVEVVGDD